MELSYSLPRANEFYRSNLRVLGQTTSHKNTCYQNIEIERRTSFNVYRNMRRMRSLHQTCIFIYLIWEKTLAAVDTEK